ncbi:MAG: SoxR reducing system RseC family protein [Spirochaetales bacterium]|jgi:positive regulator of sigma E activity|nr:SoxR reducing system RseC family protein [Spirochaetales bacterium]
MTEKAIINSIDGKIATMGCGPTEGCTSCSSSFCSTDKRVFEAVNSNGLEVKVGDMVNVYLAPGKTVAAGFLVLIVPLIFFAAGYILARKLISEPSEGLQALFGLAGLALGFGLSFYYSKKKREASMPVITKVL